VKYDIELHFFNTTFTADALKDFLVIFIFELISIIYVYFLIDFLVIFLFELISIICAYFLIDFCDI